jgi:hypothetical protein
MKRKLYARLAELLVAMENCQRAGNDEWLQRHTDTLRKLVADRMPRGAGFDNGTTLDPARSGGNKLVFVTSFHHMDENGSYDGWSEHEVIIRPSLAFGFEIRVTGRDRAGIKDDIAETFSICLSEEVDE